MRTLIAFVLFLIIGSFTTIFNISQTNINSNDILSNEEINGTDFFDDSFNYLEVADYSSSYSNTGGDVDIILHQSLVNTSEFEFSNLDNFNTLIEACPSGDSNFNSSYIKIDINHIYAPNITLDIESSTSSGNTDLTTTTPGATHFISRGNGYIENVSVKLTNIHATNDAPCQLVLYAFDGTNNRPAGTDQFDWYANLGTFDFPNNTYSEWYTLTGIHQFINNSETDDNKWFIGLFDNSAGAGDGDMYWDYTRDDNLYSGDNLDETDSYLYSAGTWNLRQELPAPLSYIDFNVKVDLTPLNNTPKPTQVNLTVNTKEVTDIDYQSGSWVELTPQINPSGNLHFILAADWWDVSCNITNVQINYTKTDLTATTVYDIPGSGQSLDWNSTLGSVNNFDARLSNYEINFTVPSKWENFSAFDDGTDKTSDIILGPIINNYRNLQISDAGNGANWYITAESENLLDTIHTYVSAVDLSTMDYTDTIDFVASLTETISDGTINLSVYSPSYNLDHTIEDSSITPGSDISLGSWKISDDVTEYGVFKIQVWWHNDTAGGFLEKDITIMAVTDLVLLSPPVRQDYFLNDIFNITVFYNDTGLNSGDQGISGATINTNTTTSWFDEGNGYYNIEVDCNEIDYSYGWNYIGIDASKTNYNSDSVTFIFHFRENTTITPSNTKDFGNVIRGDVVQYVFNYSEISGSPITGADQNTIQLDTGFGPAGLTEIGNGNYSIQLDTSNVEATALPYECIFNITDIGKETQIITLFLTVVISQTDIIIIDSDPFIIKKDGLNQSVLFYFNDTDNSIPVTGLPVDDVRVTDNQTGLPRNIWLYPNGTPGYYILNISVASLNSGWIELMINVTFDPNYATSLEPVVFYLRGNLTQTNLISVSDPGGEGTLTGISNNYTCFIGRDLFIDFNITDSDSGDALVTGLANSFLVEYVEIGNPINQGTLSESLANVTSSYQGTIGSSAIVGIGSYEITIRIFKTNFETSLLNFNVTFRPLYIINISVVDKPVEITAGDSFRITIQIKYNNGTDWLFVDGTNVRVAANFDGSPGTPGTWNPTNSTGEVSFQILTTNAVRNITLTIEVQSAYYHEGDTKEIYDIIVNAPDQGLTFEDLLPYIILIAAAVGLAGASYGVYRGVVLPKKQEKSRVLTEVKTIFDDAINLEHILVLYKGTGTCIYFKSFGSDQIDPELISGFISAISSFGKDLVSQEDLNEISYGDKMLLLSDGAHIRVALVLGKKASLILRRSLMEFINKFEKVYANELPNWRGQLNIFRDAGTLVDDVLNTSIILPHEITYEHSTAKALKKTQSREALKIANNLMKDSERNFFFIATLLKEATDKTKRDTAEIFMGIKELRDKKILMPIEIATIEAKPISQQELNLINQKVSSLVKLSPEEKQKLVNDLAQMGPAEREAYFASLAERHEIISAPVEGKEGVAVIENVKEAKKEIKNLRKNALIAKKEKDYDRSIKIFQNALKITTNWDLVKETEQLDDVIRLTKIEDLKSKMIALETEAKLAAKKENYNEAAQKYKISSKIASEIFKLGEDLTKEVKRLSNKAKEFEKLV
ncbi:MAG: hypothetical protein ACFE9Z_00560 [Promethearchaeota archaeon]